MIKIYSLLILILISFKLSFAQKQTKLIILPQHIYLDEKLQSRNFKGLEFAENLFEKKGYQVEKGLKLEIYKLQERADRNNLLQKNMRLIVAKNTQSDIIILISCEWEIYNSFDDTAKLKIVAIDAKTNTPLAVQRFELEEASHLTKESFRQQALEKVFPNFEEELQKNYKGVTKKTQNIKMDNTKPKNIQPITTQNIKSDINRNIPQTNMQNPNAIAVIIANTHYEKTNNVDFAGNDASLMKKYLVQTLGYKEGNIFHLNDIHKSEFEIFFGTKNNPKGKLFNTVKADKSDVFIYYSGHGIPSIKNQSAYFAPVECDPNYVELSGYPLDIFYDNLAKLPAKSITVVLDACFSGTDIYKNISPVFIKSKGVLGIEQGTLFASCQNNEVSTWHNEQGQGLFTYFFLKAIHNQNADTDKNGQLTFKEIYRYVSDKFEGVPYFARRLHGIEQHPIFQGENYNQIFVEY